jgi:FG-GAP repeat protein
MRMCFRTMFPIVPICACVFSAAGQPCIVSEFQQLYDSAGISSQQLGYALEATSTDIIAGAPNSGVFSYRFDGQNWSEQQSVDPLEVITGTGFGSALAAENDVLIVGAPNKSVVGTESGSAFVFRKSNGTWNFEAELVPPDGAAFDHFGLSVDVAGDLAVVGARSGGPGAAYVFQFDGLSWSEEAKLLPLDGGPEDEFGDSVAISATTGSILIGAPSSSAASFFGGAVYVFRNDGAAWVQQDELWASGAQAWEQFGFSLDVSGNTLVVGAPGEFGDPPSGAVFVFTYDGVNWVEQAELWPATGANGAYFGFSVATDGNNVLVGAPYNDYPGVAHQPGTASLFSYDGSQWVERIEYRISDPISNQSMGYAVSLTGTICALGAPMDDDMGPTTGAVYLCEAACMCPWDLTGDGVLDFFDVAAFLDAFSAANLSVDYTGDGVLDFFDVAAFLDGFSGGCP